MGSKWRPVVCALTVVIALSAGVGALAASDGLVVPQGGKVADEGYDGWLAVSWQLALKAHPPGPGPCETVQTADGPVAVLFQSFAGGKQAYTCSEPVGRPLYVVGISAECSTLEKPPFHGETPAQLERCARKGFSEAAGTASVDGHPVRNYRELISHTRVFTIHLPRPNIIDSNKQTGQSAAYGEGLLLRGLPAGTHIIHTTSKVGKVFSAEVTYTVQVH